MTQFDWARSQREVYIQQHGSEPYWIALVDDDGYAAGTRPSRPEDTAAGRDLIEKLRLRYSWIIERFKQLDRGELGVQHDYFRRQIENETERERADTTPPYRRRLERIFAAEQAVAIGALARTLDPAPAVKRSEAVSVVAAPRARAALTLTLTREGDLLKVTSSRLNGVSFWRVQFLRGKEVLGSDTLSGTNLTYKTLLVDDLVSAKRVRVEARKDGNVVATADELIPRKPRRPRKSSR